MNRRYAQPCANHEYIEPGCAECGWLAAIEDTVFVCSNPHCGAVWDDDPHGHCPKCIKPSGVGFSTMARTVLTLASVGRNPEGQDRETGLGRNDEHAVGATGAETPNPGSTPETGLVEALHNMIVLARPHFSDATQMLALKQAEEALSNVLPDEV